MDVFNAFPNAIVSDVWQLGTLTHDTDTGNNFALVSALDVIVDEISIAEREMNPNPDELNSSTLLYVKPSQLPTLNPNALVTDYLIYNSEDDLYFTIENAGIGKNQETGEVEHVEFLIKQTETAND